MTTPTEIANLVRATAEDAAVDERPGFLVLRAALVDDALRLRWFALRAALPPFVEAVTITQADGDAELDDDGQPEPDDLFRITVRTRREAGQLRLFLPDSLAKLEPALAASDHVLLAAMGANETFSTYRNRIQLWSADWPEPFAASEPLPDPRTYSSDFTGAGEVPADIRPWLIRGEPGQKGATYEAWASLAARRLMAAVADRVGNTEGGIAYHFNGPPACAITLTADQMASRLPMLHAGASWVFAEGRDPETRHLLLAAEWARTHRRGAELDLGQGSLESAKAAYAAYVKAGSKETLKALSELRKAVVDESQKAAQRAQDLAGAMWKDLAVATAPFVLKILPEGGKADARTVAGTLAIGAAAFLVFSFAIQIYINKRYFRHQKTARAAWKRELNVALRTQEVDELSEEPIRASIADYRKVRRAVGIVYFFVVLLLVVFAVRNLAAAPVENPKSQTGEVSGR